MSLPAERLRLRPPPDEPAAEAVRPGSRSHGPAADPVTPRPPARRETPGRQPATASPRPTARPRRRSRRGTVGFLVLCAVVIGIPALCLVTLNALLAQSSFRVDDLQRRIETLSQQNLELTREHASLSAPGRIAAWARRSGMRLPDDIRSLHVSGGRPAAPAGDADPLARREAGLKPILEGTG